jgi:prevent-host-death family protein
MKAAHVRSITDLKNRTKELIREISESGQSVVITQNGKAKVVVMDVEQHDRLQDTLAMLKVLAQSQESLTRTGRTYSTTEVRRRAKAVLDKASNR